MIERVTFLRCDVCKKARVRDVDEMRVSRKAARIGWKLLQWDIYGNQSHVCPWCAVGKSDKELKKLIVRKGDEDRKAGRPA